MKEIEEIFRDWLHRGQSGCHFASHAASNAKFVFSTFTADLNGSDLDAAADVVDQSVESNRVAILMFPRISGVSEMGRLISCFNHPPRWWISRVAFPDTNVDIEGVGIFFRTKRGDASAAMGFAPCFEMPMTRRAPCVGLALWGGQKSNPFFTRGEPGEVNMAHAPHLFDSRESHGKVWSKTEAATKLRLMIPAFDSTWLRKVSFCLPRQTVESVFTPPQST